MPDLDITDLLSDPDLTDRFAVIRRTRAAGPDGVDVITNTGTFIAHGYIGPAGQSALNRLPDFQLMGKSLECKTTFRLRGPSNTQPKYGATVSDAPDLVIWPIRDGDTYVVADLQDWSRFGQGFINATLSSIDFIDRAPIGPRSITPA